MIKEPDTIAVLSGKAFISINFSMLNLYEQNGMIAMTIIIRKNCFSIIIEDIMMGVIHKALEYLRGSLIMLTRKGHILEINILLLSIYRTRLYAFKLNDIKYIDKLCHLVGYLTCQCVFTDRPNPLSNAVFVSYDFTFLAIPQHFNTCYAPSAVLIGVGQTDEILFHTNDYNK